MLTSAVPTIHFILSSRKYNIAPLVEKDMLKQVYGRDGKDYCLGVSWFRSIEEQKRVTLALIVS